MSKLMAVTGLTSSIQEKLENKTLILFENKWSILHLFQLKVIVKDYEWTHLFCWNLGGSSEALLCHYAPDHLVTP